MNGSALMTQSVEGVYVFSTILEHFTTVWMKVSIFQNKATISKITLTIFTQPLGVSTFLFFYISGAGESSKSCNFVDCFPRQPY